MRNELTAVVVGAGIGGLAVGLSLRRAGWNIRIHEQRSRPQEQGFALGLAPNALMALSELGVAEPIVRAGAQLAKIELRLIDGRLLRRLEVPLGLPSVVALRPDLHGALLDAVGSMDVRLGNEAVSFSEGTQGVTVHFKDGSTDTGTILIGADGIGSTVRKALHPHEPPPRLSGFCAVRGVAYGVGDYLGDLSGVGYLDDGIEAATVRASSNAVYWYMSLRSQDVANQAPETILSERSGDFEPALRAILSSTEPGDMRFDRLFERDPLGTWGTGHVTLLGDAAHLLLPHTGQGAAQALEDAVALRLALDSSGSVEQGLRKYEAVRSRRTRALIWLGPRIARVTTTRNVVIKSVRSLALRFTPERVLGLYARRFKQDPHRALRSRSVA